MNSEQYSWHKLASVQIGGAICLPPILVGYELTRSFGTLTAFIAIGIGNILLSFLALICSEMTWRNKRTTPDNAGFYLGELGKKGVSILLALAMIGWFAIQTQVVAVDVATSTLMPESLTRAILAIVFAASLLYGLKGITRLSDLAVPVMTLTLFIVLFFTYGVNEIDTSSGWNIDLKAISMVMALAIGVSIDMPTFFRLARTRRDSHIGALVTMLIGIPFVECCGVLLATWSSGNTVMEALRLSNMPFWDIWIGLFLVLAAWTTNTTNLYSAAMALKCLIPTRREKSVFWITAIFAAVVSQFDVMGNLQVCLEYMGVALGACFGIILGSFALDQPFSNKVKLLAFIIGCLAGYLQLATGIGVLDSIIVSALTLYLRRILCISTQAISTS